MIDARPEIPARLEQSRIVAILRRTEPGAAVATAEALVSGGIPTLEVTCDSPGALEMIHAIGQALGERVFVGAGTVLDEPTARAAIQAGRASWSVRTPTRSSFARWRTRVCRG